MNKKELQRKSIFDLVKHGQITRVVASKRLYLSYRQTKRAYQRYLNPQVQLDSGVFAWAYVKAEISTDKVQKTAVSLG